MGAVPSSRLTRILQEKAEALKKKRQSAEAAQKEIEERVALLEQLGISPPESTERLRQLRELARRSDWDGVEIQAKALLDYLARTVPQSFEERRKRTVANVERLTAAGVPVAAALRTDLDALAQPAADAPWATTIQRLVAIEEGLRKAEGEYVQLLGIHAVEVARWAGLTGERLQAFERQVETAALPAREGRLAEAIEAITFR